MAPPSESALRELRAEERGLQSGLNGGIARGMLAALTSMPSSCISGTKDGRVGDWTTATWALWTRGPPPPAESVTASTKPSPCRVSEMAEPSAGKQARLRGYSGRLTEVSTRWMEVGSEPAEQT